MNIAETLVVLSIVLVGAGLSYPSLKSIQTSTNEQQKISRIVKTHGLAIEKSYQSDTIVVANNTQYYPNLQVKPIVIITGKKKVLIGKYGQIRITRNY